MIKDNPENDEQAPESSTSSFNLLELGKNLIRASQNKTEEKCLIIIGDKFSGKTTFFNALVQSSQKEAYTPTCGINYGYMRYQQSQTKKLVLNLYEIGGGIKNINFIRTIINNKNIQHTTIVLCLDFSNPHSILQSLKDYLKELYAIIKDICDQDAIIDIIENKKLKYKDTNSNEFKRINIFPGEVIVLGTKYDILEKIEVEKIKWVCRTLRFFCHINSLSLVYFKASDSKLSQTVTSMITSIAFNHWNSEGSRSYCQKNDINPLYITYGFDSFTEIGDPKVFQQGGRDAILLWEDTLQSVFPKEKNSPEDTESGEKIEESLKEKYPEARIDSEVQIFE